MSHWTAQSPSIHLSHFGDHTNAFGVGTQGLFAQESGAEAFFFKKNPCSPRACLSLLLVRVTVGHSCCLGGMKFLNCSGKFLSTYFSTALVFTCFPGWTDSNWALLGALAGEIPRDYGSPGLTEAVHSGSGLR